MELTDFARSVLFGNRWEDKLVPASSFEDVRSSIAILDIPRFPGRPSHLSKVGRSDFPKAETLHQESARGQLLHFFANHELLAMELMALALLKFPDAEKEFRLGLAHTIREEQSHLKMYVERMRELGIDFGDLPVSDYFWNALKGIESPLQFVVQMSLTLEQANLDFSLFYQQAVASVGDTKTASILETVYREEIGHVKHGLHWFNRWRQLDSNHSSFSGEDDWNAYLRLLPRPMTPRRAKGPIFCAAARREAGFSERYISEMEVYTGSKGRPPSFWFYNPLCESEIVRGKPGFTASKTVQRMVLDLETVPAFLALDTDVVLVQELPRAEWLKSLQAAGIPIPEFRKWNRGADNFPEANIAGFEPWGWSPEVFERFKPSAEKLIRVHGANGLWSGSILNHANFPDTGLGALFSKSWSLRYYQDWMAKHPEDQALFGDLKNIGSEFNNWNDAEKFLRQMLGVKRPILAKAPWGTSGTLNKKILNISEVESQLGKWIQNIIDAQGSIILEPWLDKQIDLSVQMEVTDTTPRVIGIRRFFNGGRNEYRGTFLEPKLNSLNPEQLRFLHAENKSTLTSPLVRWQELALEIASALQAKGYRGPVGIDAMIASEPETQALFLRPVVEVNPRWTMGRVAIAIESHILPATPAAWIFLPVSELEERGLGTSATEAAEHLKAKYPLRTQTKGGKSWISEGIFFTNDPHIAREVLTLLVVGSTVMADPAWKLPQTVTAC